MPHYSGILGTFAIVKKIYENNKNFLLSLCRMFYFPFSIKVQVFSGSFEIRRKSQTIGIKTCIDFPKIGQKIFNCLKNGKKKRKKNRKCFFFISLSH